MGVLEISQEAVPVGETFQEAVLVMETFQEAVDIFQEAARVVGIIQGAMLVVTQNCIATQFMTTPQLCQRGKTPTRLTLLQ